MIGKTLNHYKIVRKIGSGGMGEVYLAEDSTLNRKVALKVLPPEMAANANRLGRLEREAQAIAALNHPNIVTIYSIEKSIPAGDGGAGKPQHFITMELISGKTLSRVIPRTGMSLSQILEHGLALTEAMTAAHEKNITHRDLKPDNIMISDDGRLKILDFGLAKLKEEADPGAAGTEMPTQAVKTEEGSVLGTVAYMSPEQAEGKPADSRSDIFAIGILLYEMATGERPFQGETKISLISSILRETPRSITELNRALPRHLGRIIKRCLAKDPVRRYGNARELYNELLELKEEFDSGEIGPLGVGPGPARQSGNRAVLVTAGIVLLLAATAVIFMLRDRWSGGPAAPASIETTVTRLTQLPGPETQPSISADGRLLVFIGRSRGNWDIYFQIVGGEKVINLTEDSPADDIQPAFSPDGTQIAFRSEREGGGIFLMGTTGESVRHLTDQGYNPTWSPDGREIFFSTQGFISPLGRSGTGRIEAVRVDTGQIRAIPINEDAVQPNVSPNGKRIAYWGLREGGGQRDIWTSPAGGGDAVEVTNDAPTDWNPVWSPDGGLLYFISDRGGSMNLWRVEIDEETGQRRGPFQQVTTGTTSNDFFSLAGGGKRIAYSASSSTSNLQWAAIDPVTGIVQGKPIPITRGSNQFFWNDVSPDGEWIAYASLGKQEDIFVSRLDGSTRRQITDDRFKDRGPRWSPDGGRLAFYSDRSGSYETWTIRPDGRDMRQITETPGSQVGFPAWSPDGSQLATNIYLEDTFVILDPALTGKEQKPARLPPYTEAGMYFEVFDWSPDGKWLAGTPRASALDTGIVIYSLIDQTYRTIADFGLWPRWLNDSRRLLFSGPGNIYIADIESGEIRQILSDPPDVFLNAGISQDNRLIYFVREKIEADIWLLTLK